MYPKYPLMKLYNIIVLVYTFIKKTQYLIRLLKLIIIEYREVFMNVYPNIFSNNPLDRVSYLRSDPDWIKKTIAKDDTVFTPFGEVSHLSQLFLV
jgi:hypothetical protein